jgi:hypothetical protein
MFSVETASTSGVGARHASPSNSAFPPQQQKAPDQREDPDRYSERDARPKNGAPHILGRCVKKKVMHCMSEMQRDE